MEQGTKILLVDDDKKVINALVRVLTKKEYEIVTTTSSEEAIEILSHNKIDIIICDQNMPKILGIDVLKYAKEVLPSAIRILITGSSDINVAISAINEGNIYYYFQKPWNNGEITEVVEKSLKDKRQQEQKRAVFDLMGYSREHLLEISDKLRSVSSLLEPNSYPQNNTNAGVAQLIAKKESKEKSIKITIREDDNIILLNTADIIYLTAASGDVFVITPSGKHKSSDPLNTWEKRLAKSNFFRCHRSYLVNIDQIEKISPWFNGAYNLKLKNIKEDIPVSRNCAKELKERFQL